MSRNWQPHRPKGSAVKKVRKNYTPQEKVAILRRHLLDKVPASRLCAELQLQSKTFYGWLKQLFDHAPAVLGRQPTSGKPPNASPSRMDALQEELGSRESRGVDQK